MRHNYIDRNKLLVALMALEKKRYGELKVGNISNERCGYEKAIDDVENLIYYFPAEDVVERPEEDSYND